MNIKLIYRKIHIWAIVILCCTAVSCKKFVQVDKPIASIPADAVFADDIKAGAAVRGLYATMVTGVNSAFTGGIDAGLGVSADELRCSEGNVYYDFYTNVVTPANTTNTRIWSQLYNLIFNANAIIEQIPKSTGMTEAARKQYMGEARFMRAVMYFYLVNIYGDVPMPTTTKYEVNALLPRTPVSQIYDLIIDDLKFAHESLSPNYISTGQRFRANRYAASAMLARVALYLQDWQNAELAATDVIDGGRALYGMEPDLTKTFLIGSKEIIMQLPPIETLNYTYNGYIFGGTLYPLNQFLYNNFEAGDLRKANWIRANGAEHYMYKYKVNSGSTNAKTEGMIFLRVAETYLIRAEARAQLNNLSGAISDLDVIRKRSGVRLVADVVPDISKDDLLGVIIHERYVELFAELGHRWFDLKRTGRASEVFKNKPNWRPEALLMPIPKDDMDRNPALVQNPGYIN